MLTVHKPRQLGGVSVQLCCRGRGMLPSGSVVNTPNDLPRPQGGGALLIPLTTHLGLVEFADLCSGTDANVDVSAKLTRFAPVLELATGGTELGARRDPQGAY
jgi:hypothetical protein